jgi:hypothetical protein
VAHGSKLAAILKAESVLHWDLRAQGHRLYLEPTASTFHLNYSLALATISLRFLSGQLFVAARARFWSALRRFLYSAAGPLIPLVLLRRVLRDLGRIGELPRLGFSILPVLMLALASDAAGEMVGYLFGGKRAMHKLTDMEYHRHRYLSENDRQRLTSEP